MEVAVTGALHDRLRPFEAHTLVVTLAERGVALARKQVPNLAEPMSRYISAYSQRVTLNT